MTSWDEAHSALLAEATSARAKADPMERADALHRVAGRTAESGAKGQARALWEEAATAACIAERSGDPRAATVLSEIALALARVGDVDAATFVAGAIAHAAKRERALGAVRTQLKSAR